MHFETPRDGQATPAAALKGLLPFGMLGASPDGMLLHDMKLTAVEIKCPFPMIFVADLIACRLHFS